jgi:hypothetical protein
MELIALYVVAACSLAAVAFVLGGRLRPTLSELPLRETPEALADYERRLVKLEAEFPHWKLSMEQLVDEASAIFEATERKRRSAAAAAARVKAAETSEDAPGPTQLFADESEQRAAILRAVRARRGG